LAGDRGRFVAAGFDFRSAGRDPARLAAFWGFFDIIGFLTGHLYRAAQRPASGANEREAALQLGPRPL
jgi:hypothetical protein